MAHSCPDAVRVIPLSGLKVRVFFADGEVKECDLSGLGGVFMKLRDREIFKKVHAESGAIVWSEDLDLAPEYIYEHGESIK